MKLVDGIILSKIDDQYVVVDGSDREERFNGMIKLNKSGAFVADLLKKETTLEEIVAAMMEHYEVTEEAAKKNAQRIIDGFKSVGLLA